MKEPSQIDRIPVEIRKALASARRRETLAKQCGTVPEQMAAFKEVQRLSTIAFSHTQPGEVKQEFLKPDDEYNRDFAALRSDFCLRKSIEMYESGPMTDGQRALYEAMKREVSSRAMDEARYSGDLTDLQQSVLAQLRADNRPFLAAVTEQHWRRGESYYIDSRVSVSKRLRAQFNKANPEQRQ